VQALNNYDIPTVMGVIVFSTIIIIVFNLVVDLLYAVIDPRIRLA
jgi:peptide/nickel transport system permease protein